MTPLMEARAYIIWAYASKRNWDCSYAEIADGTGLTHSDVKNTIAAKRWAGRVPTGADAARATKHQLGYSVDTNLLAVDQLMR